MHWCIQAVCNLPTNSRCGPQRFDVLCDVLGSTEHFSITCSRLSCPTPNWRDMQGIALHVNYFACFSFDNNVAFQGRNENCISTDPCLKLSLRWQPTMPWLRCESSIHIPMVLIFVTPPPQSPCIRCGHPSINVKYRRADPHIQGPSTRLIAMVPQFA